MRVFRVGDSDFLVVFPDRASITTWDGCFDWRGGRYWMHTYTHGYCDGRGVIGSVIPVIEPTATDLFFDDNPGTTITG